MNSYVLLLDLIPVIIFVVLDSLGKVKYAVIGAVLAAVLELLFSHFYLGRIDEFSLIYVALFLIFGGLSYKFNNSLFFKFKSVVLSAVTGLIFLVTHLMDNPFMVMFLDRYGQMVPQEIYRFYTPAQLRTIFARVSFYMIFGMFAHAGLVAWVALRYSTWWWFAARNVGILIIMFLALQLSM